MPVLMRAYYGVEADERMFRGGTEIWECPAGFPGEGPCITVRLDVVGYRLVVPKGTAFTDPANLQALLTPSADVRQKWETFARWMREAHSVELPEPRVIVTFEKEPYW